MRLAEEAHSEGESWVTEYWDLLIDPAHAMSEITMSILWDIVIITLLYQLLVKRVLYPRWVNRVHKEIDAEHGVDHDASVGTGTNGSHVKVFYDQDKPLIMPPGDDQ